ncbi:NPCBM/NEW2 domain-containing protein [Vibrio nigripulchritudo]|uniref:NPCBM/NEW2 domain-containing protein n=1 Tax=Vibrio nigripulchritudo TaxID=28173 RepID=UPI0005FA2003|nr:NPCBM/NEW2 domain-containing protein [Vibrio nigripulchritudo]KJY80265.1 ricin B lectin [Vibrio nigripulchritudo]
MKTQGHLKCLRIKTKHFHKCAITALLSVFTLNTVQANGPGLGNPNFSSNDVYTHVSPLIDDTTGFIPPDYPGRAHYGLNMLTMVNGYAVGVFAPDHGQDPGGWIAIDVSDPRNPVKVNQVYEPDSSNIHRTGDALRTKDFTEAHSLGLSEGNLIVTHNSRSIEIWDWSDVNNPVRRSKLSFPGIILGGYSNIPWNVFWQAPYLYVARGTSGLSIVDTTDIDNPVLVKTIPRSELGGFVVGSVLALGNELHLASREDRGGFSILNIDDPINPELTKVVNNLPYNFYISCWDGKYANFGPRSSANNLVTYDTTTTPMSLVNEHEGEYVNLYCNGQDDKLFLGNQEDVAILDVSDKQNYVDLGKGSLNASGSDTDHGQVFPFGNMVWVGNDHGSGSGFLAHTEGRDLTPPQIVRTLPQHDDINVSPTARIGLALSDSVLMGSVTNQTFKVIPAGSQNPIDGTYSVNLGFVHFSPSSPLADDQIYQVIVDGVEDFTGNPMPEVRYSFSTGNVASHDVNVSIPNTVEVGQYVNAVANASPIFGGALEYSWDFGDGTPPTPFSSSNSISYLYEKVGHWSPIVTVRENGFTSTESNSVTVHYPTTTNSPSNSSTIVGSNGRVFVVNPDNDTVSSLSAVAPFQKLWERAVTKGPKSIAEGSDGNVWVVSEGSDSIHILSASNGAVIDIIRLSRGARPNGVAFTPDGTSALVSLYGLGELIKIDPNTRNIAGRVDIGHSARGIAIASDSDKALVTRFISLQDKAEVAEVDVNSMTVIRQIALNKDTTTIDGPDRSRGIANYLNSVTISPDGKYAWLPSNKANVDRGTFKESDSDKGLTFETTVRAIVSQIDMASLSEVPEKQLDIDNNAQPKAVVFSPLGDYSYVAMEGRSNIEVLDAYTGDVVSQLGGHGLAPNGLVRIGDYLFVHNFLSRSVSVWDVKALETVQGDAQHIAQIDVVSTEKLSPRVLTGKRLFHDASNPRMNKDGYLSCASCHADGGSDGRNWDFTDRGEGVRNTIPLTGRAGMNHGNVHWTANFDEIQDFENDIRFAFEGRGFIPDALFEDVKNPLGQAKTGISTELDNLAIYVSSLSTFNKSPYRNADGSLTASATTGQSLFTSKGCDSCHSGSNFTDNKRHDVGTIDASSGTGIGVSLAGIGFDTPTLLGLVDSAPYFHNGKAPSLDDVLQTPGVHYVGNQTERGHLTSYLLQLEYEGLVVAPSTDQDFEYASDLPIKSSTNGWGPVEIDQSVGGQASNDGGRLSIGGVTFEKGFGAHSNSEIVLDISGKPYDQFSSFIGIDSGAGSAGSVIFEVWVDGVLKYRSNVLRGNDPIEFVVVPLSLNAEEIKLIATDAGDGIGYDHANWADVKLRLSSPTYIYASDLNEQSATNGWGPLEKDMSVGWTEPGDGDVLSVGGTRYARGLGAHANSSIVYDISEYNFDEFKAVIGIDDNAGNRGSAVFKVLVDGVLSYESNVVRGDDDAIQISVPLDGSANEVRLEATDAGDGNGYDHANWADAKFRVREVRYVFASDLQESESTNGWGPVEKDMNVGQQALGDGQPMYIDGEYFAKGLGAHANSRIVYDLTSQPFSAFSATVGVDDGTGNGGSVVFKVLVDGSVKFDSGLMRGSDQSREILVPLGELDSNIELIVEDGGDGNGYDWADWGNARFRLSDRTYSYASDLTEVSSTNGWGPIEKDMNVGQQAQGDGQPISVGGKQYAKGLGLHAESEVVYSLTGANFDMFSAVVGVDDGTGSKGSVIFQVFVDGEMRYQSALLTGGSAPEQVSIPITSEDSVIRLVSGSGGDGIGHDWADWADAKFRHAQ